jgi:NADH-quinone oxidoreductase subunit M
MLATIGLVVTAIFLLNMIQKVCFGPLNEKWKGLADMTAREIAIAAALMFFMFWIGINPGSLVGVSNSAAVKLVESLEHVPHAMAALGY